MTDHTVDSRKLVDYLKHAVHEYDPPITHAKIAVDTALEITVEIPSIIGATCDGLLDIFGLKYGDLVVSIEVHPDHADVTRINADDEIVTDRYDYE